MGKYDELDLLLKENLKPEYAPTDELNQRILRQIREEKKMAKKSYERKKYVMRRRVSAAAIGLSVCVLAGSAAYAAIRYLTPGQAAAEAFENGALAKAFEEPDAILLNEQKEEEGYLFTLLGITSGKGLNGYLEEGKEELQEKESYAVLAIEKADGAPMPQISDEAYDQSRFLVSPLIGGQEPGKVNVYSLSGTATEFVKDGIAYRIVSCRDLTMFADRGVYLAVCRDLTDLREGYQTDRETGRISSVEAYEGVNVLFQVPLDENEADREAAEQVLAQVMQSAEETAESATEYPTDLPQDLEEWMKQLEQGMRGNDIEECCHMVEGTEQTVSADADGIYQYYVDGMLNTYLETEFLDKSGEWQLTGYGCGDTLDSLEITMYQYQPDDTVLFAIFTPDSAQNSLNAQ